MIRTIQSETLMVDAMPAMWEESQLREVTSTVKILLNRRFYVIVANLSIV